MLRYDNAGIVLTYLWRLLHIGLLFHLSNIVVLPHTEEVPGRM